MITNVTTAVRTPGPARRTGVPWLPFLALLAALAHSLPGRKRVKIDEKRGDGMME